MTGVAAAEEIEDSMPDHMASPASKAFNESRLHRLMSFVLPLAPQSNLESELWHIYTFAL